MFVLRIWFKPGGMISQGFNTCLQCTALGRLVECFESWLSVVLYSSLLHRGSEQEKENIYIYLEIPTPRKKKEIK